VEIVENLPCYQVRDDGPKDSIELKKKEDLKEKQIQKIR